jgi:hypothetical protein
VSFPSLEALANDISKCRLDGRRDCSEIIELAAELRGRYLSVFKPVIALFNKNELRDVSQRAKFLKRLRDAATHLLEVYFGSDEGTGVEELSLSRHPSHGMKDFADRMYKSLEQHWRCRCSNHTNSLGRRREARLNLTRHRSLASKVGQPHRLRTAQLPAKFEVLLPICEDAAAWKITNIEVKLERRYVDVSP